MKKLAIIAAALIAFSASGLAQDDCCKPASSATTHDCCAVTGGKFQVHDFGDYQLHIYLTGDEMGDASFIIEGKDALVTLEQPLFKANAAIFDNYLGTLGKPVSERISDFHLGNTGDAPLIVPQGMAQVFKGPEYSGMMAHFAQVYGDAIEPAPTGTTKEVPFGKPVTMAGIPLTFIPGASNDFPGANILIGSDVVYSHFAPARAHINTLYAADMAGVEARISELERILATDATLFVGGHGNPASADDVRFMIDYLGKVKALRSASSDAATFAKALIAAYPALPGQEGVTALAEALYTGE